LPWDKKLVVFYRI